MTILSRNRIAWLALIAGGTAFGQAVVTGDWQSGGTPFRSLLSPDVVISTPPSLPPAIVGMLFSQTLTASSGAAPYIFSLTPSAGPNALPPGLNLGTNGVLSGTPTAAGSFSFNITVTDVNRAQSSTQFNITIAPALAISTPSPLPAATVGVSYSQTIAVTGGTPQYSYSTTGSVPPGLAYAAGVLSGIPTSAGLYAFGAVVTDKNNFSTFRQYQISVAAGTTILQVSAQKLSFAAFAGGDAAPPQTLAISSPGGAQATYSLSIDSGAAGTPAPPWLSVTPLSGSAPAGVSVIASPGGMSVGVYTAVIHVSVMSSTGMQAPIDVQVTFTITTAQPKLDVTPTSLNFAARVQAPGGQDQVIAVRNQGGGGLLAFAASVVGGSSWIVSVTPNSGQTAPNAPQLVHVLVDSQGLSNGSYHDIVRITTPAGNFDVAIRLFVSSPGAIIGLTANGLRFPVRQGSGSSRPQVVNVLNLGDLTSPLNPTVDVLSGSDWLRITQTGLAPAALVASTLNVTAGGDANTLPVGGHYALVRVSDPGAVNSPQYLVVVLDVQPGSAAALLDPSPPGLFFTSTTAAQNVVVNTSSTAAVAFQASASTSDGAAWLAVGPASGTASTQSPGNLTVRIAPGGLAPGVYSGNVNIAIAGAVRLVNVTLVIPRAAAAARPGSLVSLAAGCTPASLAITQSGIVNNFSVPAGWPAALLVQLNDDCGNAISNASVTASFSNSDPPLTLTGDGTSNVYSATWQPAAIAASTTVTVRAAAGAFSPAVARFQGGVIANESAPALIPDGALHIFFDVPTAQALGAGLAPGNVAQVYGTGMAAVSQSPGVVPLLNEFSGTFMLIGSSEAPLFYVSGGLLDVQVPFELIPNRQYSALVSANGALSLPETITVVPFQPGMAALADGTVIAQHVLDNFSLVTSANPAKPGEPIVIYLSGMGATNPAVPSGQQTPSQLVPAATQPTMTVDGQPADIGYAGLTPSGIGLYQINFTVPRNARSGNLEVIVTQSGVRANTTMLPVSN